MSSFLCEGTWEIVRVLSCIMRGFFDLVVRNKECFLVSTYCMNVVVSLRRNVGNRESLVLYNARIF